MASPPNPVIVVPGVTATYLKDYYPLPPEAIWGPLPPGALWNVFGTTQNFERSEMHPSDLRYEAAQPAAVRADQVFEVAYRELIEALRYELTDDPRKPVPVYPFGYDWRRRLAVVETGLAAFIDEVIDRTKLLKHYERAGYADAPKVNLVGHSMGGLIIAGYLESFGAAKVDRVATLATPFRGSFEAIVKLATGTANIGGSNPSSQEREAARATPSLYHLLPDFKTGVEMDENANLPRSTFDVGFFQPSIVETLASYIERHAVRPAPTKAGRREEARNLLGAMLAEARGHRERIAGLDLAKSGLSPDHWLCVVGVDTETRVRMTVMEEDKKGDPVFELTSKDRINDWTKREFDPKLTGDGTVHFCGAAPAFLRPHAIICVTPDDFGYWEAQDILLAKATGFHGILPNMDMLHRLIARHFTGRPDPRGNTWGRTAPGVEIEGPWRPAGFELRIKED